MAFAMIFSVIGSYTALYALAAPEGADYNIIVTSTPHERAWFSSALGASTALLALGPILVFFLWWLWRRSSFVLSVKLLITLAPLLLIMKFS